MLDNWQRIEKVVSWTGLSVNSFALSIGLSRGENLYQIKRGNNGISRELAQMISAKYPQISRGWVLTGEGEMFLEDRGKKTALPFFEVDVEKYVASPGNFVPAGYISLPGVGDADFGAVYYGRAMGCEIPVGSTVVMKRVVKAALIPGGDYLVVADGVTALRRVRRQAGSEELRLTPVDRENFDEIILDAAAVRDLFLVRAVVVNKTL